MNDTEARIDALINEGIQHQRAERFREAEIAYRAVLQLDRTNPKALALIGMLAGMFGNFQAAIDLFLRALPRDPENADLYHNLGETYRHMGATSKALPAFNRALQLRPDHFESYRSAADTAIAAAAQAGNAEGGAPARELRRMAAQFLLLLARRRYHQRLGGVEELYREAAELDPDNDEIIYGLGTILQENFLPTEAVEVLRRAIALDPTDPQAHNNLGNAYYSLQRWNEMEEEFRTAVALDPKGVIGRNNLVSTGFMRWLYDDRITPAEICDRHRAWGMEVAAELGASAAPAPPFVNSPDPDRKLRIAYLSGDFLGHPVAAFFHPLLANHDPAEVEPFCYSEVDRPDAMTESLRRLCGTWRDTFRLSDEALRAQLRADAIDIAIDLAGQTAKNRLRALAVKPAPVTATWLGYPATTGLSTIDWRITDALADPPGAERFHTERLARLPDGFLCYEPPLSEAPEVAPPPALTRAHVTFGSFNNPLKMSPATVAAWAAILTAAPQSRLLLKGHTLGDSGVRPQILDRFAAHGIAPQRIEMRSTIADAALHLGLYGEVDVALDPFPYNGTTTTCEALWMGVPVVTLIGDSHRGRVGLDLLTRVGLADLAAPSVEAYVATALALARDMPRLQQIRGMLRERMRSSPLCDAKGFARAFEHALREMWREWCRAQR